MQLPGCRMNSEEFSSTTPESLNLSDHEIKRKLWYAFVPPHMARRYVAVTLCPKSWLILYHGD